MLEEVDDEGLNMLPADRRDVCGHALGDEIGRQLLHGHAVGEDRVGGGVLGPEVPPERGEVGADVSEDSGKIGCT